METSQQIRKLEGKKIEVGTPHAWNPTKLFFNHGILVSVSANTIELLTPKGKTVIIGIERIMQINECDY